MIKLIIGLFLIFGTMGISLFLYVTKDRLSTFFVWILTIIGMTVLLSVSIKEFETNLWTKLEKIHPNIKEELRLYDIDVEIEKHKRKLEELQESK